MKKVLIILMFLFTKLHADDFKLEKIINGLERPWSLSFIDNKNILVTEKPGKIKIWLTSGRSDARSPGKIKTRWASGRRGLNPGQHKDLSDFWEKKPKS